MFKLKHHRYSKVSSVGKMMFYSSVVGVITGFGAVIFLVSTHFLSVYVLSGMAGYPALEPSGEPELFHSAYHKFSPILLVSITTFGGLLSGFLVYTFAPEAEGHGTDSAIESYHKKDGIIKPIVPIIKIVASVITLGSGGSGGREGPIAQIGAGFGSAFASHLKLSKKNRRILLLSGMGAGVGAIFHAPMAGAIFAVEVLYKEMDLESEVLIYAIIASIVAYSVFCVFFGWMPLFKTPSFHFQNPIEIISYLILSIVVSLSAIFYVKIFYGMRKLFKKIPIKPHFKPAIGGALVGLIGVFVPDAISMGYGALQKAMVGDLTISALLLIAFLKIFATSFTISSGGSAGVFGPSMVIGGALGAAVGLILHNISPVLASEPGAFTLVGMVGFFAACANTPFSTIIMVTEMTGNYHLIVPSLLVASISYLIAQKHTIYEKQVKNRHMSPAHYYEFTKDILQDTKVSDIMLKRFSKVYESATLDKIYKTLSNSKDDELVVVDMYGKFSGIITMQSIKSLLNSQGVEKLVVAMDLASKDVITTTEDENLHTLLQRIGFQDVNIIPVLDKTDNRKIIAIIKSKDIVEAYDKAKEKLLKS